MKRLKRSLALLLALVMVCTMLPAAVHAADAASGLQNFVRQNAFDEDAFEDVRTTDWFYKNVESVYELGLMVGKSARRFDPNGEITLAETVAIAARLHAIYHTGTENFDQGTPWYGVYVDYALKNGILKKGHSDYTAKATRAQFAQILANALPDKALKAINQVDNGAIPDVDEDADYAEAVYMLYRAGILMGQDSKGHFAPKTKITRCEVAAIVARMADESLRESIELKKEENKKPSNPGIEWPVGPEEPETEYTVTFVANGENVENLPEKQSVKSGETANMPNNPWRAGFVFSGWYLEASATNQFSFETTITSDLTLYAKWEVADDATDPDDTVVSPDDVFTLSADQREVLTDSNTQVVFYVNSTATTSNFELYQDGVSTGVLLYDDGDYDNHFDDIPNDGCYTGVYSINQSEEADVFFTANATIGGQEMVTNSVDVFVYTELTDEDTEQMDVIESVIIEIVAKAQEDNNYASNEDMIEAICKDVDKYLVKLEKDGVISNIEYYESSYTYTWYYNDIGIDTYIQIYDDKSDDTDFKEENRDKMPINTMKTATKVAGTPNINYSKGEVVILNYYGEDHSWSNFYDTIGDQFTNAGFTVTNIYDFSCDDFKHLQKYNSMILLNSHGNTMNGSPSGKPMICTAEEQSKPKNKEYSADLKKDRIEKVTLQGGEKVYWVAPKLFEYYYQDDSLSSPIVYLGCCRNYAQNPDNEQMVSALYNAGATSVLGYSSSVSVPYDNNMAETLVEELIKGKSINEALTTAKSQHGARDTSIDDDWNVRAALNLFGSQDAVLYHPLLNGKFDSVVNYLNNAISVWKEYGDARSIYRLAGLKPQSNPKMAIISSGFGSMNDETTSCLYQTFLVPENAQTLSFTYDVVSEEPFEWVGTKYDDIFKAEILDTDGNVLETLCFESVNTSTWYAIDGIDFPGGDDTTYHTRWSTYSTNVISKYQSQLVVLRFMVQDSGDEIYDTAVLLDSVVIGQ